MVSLSYKEDNPHAQEMSFQITSATSGLIFLQHPPDFINVELNDSDNITVDEWSKLSLSSTNFIIPIPRRRQKKDTFKFYGNMVQYSEMAVELGFSITFNKAQGKTLQKVILNINHLPVRELNRVEFSHLVVGLSRVKNGQDLRIFPVQGNNLDHLKKMHLHDDIRHWLLCMKEDNTWKYEDK